MKAFNTAGVCVPEKHYMVDLTERVAQIRTMVDEGKYFCINCARQYGKTTTLTALRKRLTDIYTVVSLDFQAVGDAGFQTEEDFTQAFCGLIEEEIRAGLVIPDDIRNRIDEIDRQVIPAIRLNRLFRTLSEWCSLSERPIVLIIDEVDSATNNQVFLDFLAQLRKRYLDRDAKGIPAFQSVILAGVTDVKHLKSKIRDEEQHKVNSPWNTREGNEPSESLLSFGDCPRDQMAQPFDIAADFTIDMSLSCDGIAQMLEDYAKEHRVETDIPAVSKAIHDATAGYPYLVSKICKMIDEKQFPGLPEEAGQRWTAQGVDAAINALLREEGIPLFESLIGKLENYPELSDAVEALLMRGESMEYLPYDTAQSQLRMYGLITTRDQKAVIANRIFESLLYDYYLGKERTSAFRSSADIEKNRFVTGGRLDMEMILERFVVTYHDILGDPAESGRFYEKDGRELFLLYLKPIINGNGNYYIEAQTRDQTRTDVIVDYRGEQFVIEMKIWRGDAYHQRGEQQLLDYLDYFHLNRGYMLSFNFNKNKQPGIRTVRLKDRTIVEAVV